MTVTKTTENQRAFIQEFIVLLKLVQNIKECTVRQPLKIESIKLSVKN